MKQQEVLFLLGSAVIIVFVWIAFTIIHNSLTSTISENINQIIVPIDPTFDAKTVDLMTKRSQIIPLYKIQPPTQNSIVVSSSPQSQPISTQSAQSASSGGILR